MQNAHQTDTAQAAPATPAASATRVKNNANRLARSRVSTEAWTSATDSFGNPKDPWATASTNYDPNKRYVRATDGNGHDVNMQVKVSPALAAQISYVLDGRMIPEYRTKADLVRDALVHHLYRLSQEHDGAVNLSDLEIELRQAELDSMRERKQAWTHFIESLDRDLEQTLADGDIDLAEYMIEENAWNDAMTPPYLMRLGTVIAKHRARLRLLLDQQQ